MIDFDSYFGKPRPHCTGGWRYLDILPDGSVTRCAHLRGDVVGNITDPGFKARLLATKNDRHPCAKAVCHSSCGATFSEQEMHDGVLWAGREVTGRGFRDKDYLVVQYDITHRCNFTCAYCCAATWMNEWEAQKKGVLSVPQVEDMCHWMASCFEGGLVCMIGGEPTLHPGFSSVARIMCEAGWKFDLTTNFSNPEKVVRCIEQIDVPSRRNFRLVYSLHAHQEGFNWERSKAGLARLREVAPNMQMCLVIIDYAGNEDAFRPEDHADFLNEVKAWWTVFPDAYRLMPVRFE